MITNPARFDFFEIVPIRTAVAAKAEVDGELGAVLGRAFDVDSGWSYSIHIYTKGECWTFLENELVSTGERALRSDFYDGSAVRISVDKDGRSRIVKDM